MKPRYLNLKATIICLALLALTAVAARYDVIQHYTPWDKEFYLTRAQLQFIRPGLQLKILGVQIPSDFRPVVTFSIADPKGLPLDRDGVFTPGPVTARFILAYIPSGKTQYTNYILSPTTGRPTSDSTGDFTLVQDGVYTYRFKNALPQDYDVNALHRLAVFAGRDLREFDLSRYYVNEFLDFAPSGAEITQVRDIVRTENCNECHNKLALHGGSRLKVELCILCHNEQNGPDAITGNTFNFPVMIHKIHMSEDLPSVKAGKPYLLGVNGRNEDFSDIAFPQDIRNCEKCHKNATQGSAWFERPNRAACGSCHDDVNFASGEGHVGVAQISDKDCSSCHFPEGELEFDASIKGAHTIPYKSNQLKGLKISIESVSDTKPGQNPKVLFQITENSGNKLDPNTLNSLSFVLAGPTTDYSTLIREPAVGKAAQSGDSYLYVFQGKVPDNAQGSFAVGAEGYRMVTLNPGTVNATEFRETAENPVVVVAVTDTTPVPRRQVVDDAKCEKCHQNLALHGTTRHDAGNYCVMCHIPSGTDEARRPASQLPVQSRHFKFMIHRIHRGEHLTRDFTIYGFGNNAHNYNELRFPGDLRDCKTCHAGTSYQIPLLAAALPTTTPREFMSVLQPVAGACLGCHDTVDAAAHAATMTAPARA